MKKAISMFLALTMIFALAACSGNPSLSDSSSHASSMSDTESTESGEVSVSQQETKEQDSDESTPNSIIKETEDSETDSSKLPDDKLETGSKTLVVYFSQPETTDPDSMTKEEDNSVVVIDGKVLGNTQYVAYVIQEQTGADIFRIERETPYPTDHETLVDLAANEQADNARPAIKDTIENLDQYDTIFVGYPNWWGDMPMILYTFFDTYDFSGKTIIPFNTHGGSGFSGTIGTIADLEPDAAVDQNGFTVSRNNVQEAKPDIISWLNERGY